MTYRLQPGYLTGKNARLFSVHFKPLRPAKDPLCIVLSPAFEEEMNRCRYMCNLLAQAVTELGYGVLSVDPYGTGDSEGHYRDIDWQQMSEALLVGHARAQELGYRRIVLHGIRLGALPAAEIAAVRSDINHILFWQPVVSGKSYMIQLLRMKIAAALARKEEIPSIRELELLSESGQLIDVSGYELSPQLIDGIRHASMDELLDKVSAPITWFTTLASQERKPPAADVACIERWLKQGKSIEYREVIGPPYWQVHERTLARNLITATASRIKEIAGG